MQVKHDLERQRFYVPMPHGDAEMNYELAGEETLDLVRTWVPPEDRHSGTGAKLVLAVLEWAREHGKTIIPTCPFVSWMLEQHPEFQDLVAQRA